MDGMVLAATAAAIAGMLVGAIAAWRMRANSAQQELGIAEDNWRRKIDQAEQKCRSMTNQASSLRASLEDTQRLALEDKHAAVSAGTELESVREQVRSLSQELSTARAERNEYESRHSQGQQYVIAAKQRVTELSQEFEKSRVFYKGQIGNAIEQRHALERKLEDLQSEKESLTTLLASAKSEYDSISRMLTSSRARLEKLDDLEKRSIELEADNAELRHRLDAAQRDKGKLLRQIEELEDMKSQNRELSRCLDSMEDSRKQYEADARRYRDQYEQSEKESETLRLKLGDIEKSLTDMQQAHDEANRITRMPEVGESAPEDGDGDDLTEIVGIGKVFEAMLHRLGIYYYRQIATFGAEELARVNAELKEFKGRIEHDDWIGQARELHYRKYGLNGIASSAG